MLASTRVFEGLTGLALSRAHALALSLIFSHTLSLALYLSRVSLSGGTRLKALIDVFLEASRDDPRERTAQA